MSAQAVAYRCPHCQETIDVDLDQIGATIRCPNEDCGKSFEVDAAGFEESPAGVETAEDGQSRDPLADGIGNSSEQVVVTVHPSMFRARPLKFLGLWTLCVLGVFGLITWLISAEGLVIRGTTWLPPVPLLLLSTVLLVVGAGWLVVWWLKTIYVTLQVTTVRSLITRGIISRETSEVRHTDVRNIQVEQNIYQRIVGVGDIAISSAGQAGLEIDVDGIPHPDHVADRIREMQ